MKTVVIIDRNSINGGSKRRTNQAGFLVLPDCSLAKSGILQYSDVQCEDGTTIADGALISVYRPKEALKSCYKQFANLPLTLRHPESQEVSPKNAKDVVVGALGSNPRYEERDGEGYIICDIIVYDDATIAAIEDGDYEELSAGYETAFRQARGVSPKGSAYEAEQFYLSPNHVALVEKGRCGSECRICDHAENQNSGEVKMARRVKKASDSKASVRWLLAIGDEDEAVEITEEQAQALQAENPEVEVEEVTEDELDEELDMPGVEPEDSEADEGEEDPETDEDEGEEPPPAEVDKDEEKPAETDEGEELVYEVQFEDGTTGKMDENTYKQIQRYMDVTKKGDAAEQTVASLAVLSSHATRILGDSFDMANYVRGNVVDSAAVKKAVIKKVMPRLITKALKGDALDRVFDSAVKTFAADAKEWGRDIANLSKAADRKFTADAKETSPLQIARAKYVDRINGRKKEE